QAPPARAQQRPALPDAEQVREPAPPPGAEMFPPPQGPGTPVAEPPAAEGPEAPSGDNPGDGDDCKPVPFWQRVPVVQPFPRPGWFILPPTGPGYYSLADVLHGEYRKAPPKYPYPRFNIIPFSFFECDWRYLEDPKNEEHDYFDF